MEFNTSLPEGWQAALPEDLRNSGVIANVNDLSAIVKMAIDGRNLASDHVRIPGENSKPEVREAFLQDMMKKVPELVAIPEDGDLAPVYEKLGRPKDVNGYELPEVPDPVKEKFNPLTEKAFELGVTKDQFKGIAEVLVEDITAKSQKEKTAIEKEQSLMKESWGQAYPQKLASLSHFAEQTGFSEDFVAAVGAGEIEAKNMKALEKVMSGFEGSGIEIGTQPGDPTSGITPIQAEEQLDEIMGDKDGPYYDVSNPAHKATVAKVHDLVVAADAGKKATQADEFRKALTG